MPRYDYRCVECRNEFELLQTFAEAGNATCPACSGMGRRVYHAVPVIYKGSGFYTTDYGRPMRPSENGSKEPPDSKSGSGSSSTDDAPSAKESKKESGGSPSGNAEPKSESAAKTSTEAETSS